MESVQRLVFMLAVLMAVSGMCLAVMSLPLPVARVKTEYKDQLLKGTQMLRQVNKDAIKHAEMLKKLLRTDICGGRDVQKLTQNLNESKQASANLKIEELQDYCNKIGLENAVAKEVPFCLRYAATKLYFKGNMSYNESLHGKNARKIKTQTFDGNAAQKRYQKAKESYLEKVIENSRSDQLKTLERGDTDLAAGAHVTNKICLTIICTFRIVSKVAMLIPFFGILAQAGFLLALAIENILLILIKLSKLQLYFRIFEQNLRILNSKLTDYEIEKTIQFSLTNFNLIYLSYPALLTGCMGMLVGFWYRKAAATSYRRRASFVVLLPLIVLNVFGLGVTFAWTHFVSVVGEAAPMVRMSMTPLAAVTVLRVGYVLVLAACLLFLLLALLHQRHLRQHAAKPKPQPHEAGIELETTAFLSATVSEKKQALTAMSGDTAEASKEATRKKEKRVTVTRGKTRHGSTWVLALLFALASAGCITVIFWKPVFAMDFDLNDDTKERMKLVMEGVQASAVASRELDDSVAHCDPVGTLVTQLVLDYMKGLKEIAKTQLAVQFKDILTNATVTFQPAVQHIQVPLLLAVYLPVATVLWGAVTSSCCPSLTPSPRSCARLASAMAWLSVGWMVNAMLFLNSVVDSGAVPLFSIQVYTTDGVAYVMAASIGLMLVSQELRIGTIAPIL